MSLLCVQDLRVQAYIHEEWKEIVHDFSVEIKKGEILGIVGESGSGKSTAIRAMVGLLPPHIRVSARKLTLEDRDILPPSDAEKNGKIRKKKKIYDEKMRRIRGNEIAFVFQDPLTYLNPTRTVGKQLEEAIRIHRKVTAREAKIKILSLLEMVGIRHKERRLAQYPFELSGGIRQRILIAMALACEPKLIIADEPTTALDVTVQQQILTLLKKIVRETNTAILLVSHDLRVIASMAERVLVMKQGHIVEEGEATDIFYNPKEAYTRQLVYQTPSMEETQPKVKEQEVILQVQHVVKNYQLQRLVKKYEHAEAISDMSFMIREGETFGLVGESGCGKSTLASLIMGIHKPDSGTISYRKMSIASMKVKEKKAFYKRVQMIFQDPYGALDPRCTVGEILREPLQVCKTGTRDMQENKVKEMLCLVGLKPEDATKYPHAFSGGERQRIGIARALILSPELLICDEPLASLDASIQVQILGLLKDIQQKKGLTCLFISHDLQVVRQISNRMGIMYAGRIIELGDTKEIYQNPLHPYTKTLLLSILRPRPDKNEQNVEIVLPVGRQHMQEISGACPFATSCTEAMSRCLRERPKEYTLGMRKVACFLYD